MVQKLYPLLGWTFIFASPYAYIFDMYYFHNNYHRIFTFNISINRILKIY
jgi:hypothetical protein